MDLQDKYDELENIVSTIDNLTNELTDKYYIDCLNEIKFEAQNELTDIEEQLEAEQEREYNEMVNQYWEGAI